MLTVRMYPIRSDEDLNVEHPDGASFTVANPGGELYVYDSAGTTLAAYPSGAWRSATVTTATPEA